MRKDDRARQLPEITRYTKYYEHDGMLRAYANRSMLLAMIFGLLAMVSLGFAVYVRVLPPTVIRVDKDGNAFAVIGPRDPGGAAALNLSVDRIFLRSASRCCAYRSRRPGRRAPISHSLSRLHARLGRSKRGRGSEHDDREPARIHDEQASGRRHDRENSERTTVISDFEIRSIEHMKGTPWTYTVFGVKEIHRVKNQAEATDQIVGKYNVRLVETTPFGNQSQRASRSRVRGGTDGGRSGNGFAPTERPRQGQTLKERPSSDRRFRPAK